MKTKKAIIVAMATFTGATVAQETEAMRAAMHDMQADGIDTIIADYTWDPYRDGLIA